MLQGLARHRDVGYAVAVGGLGEAELLTGEQYNHQSVWPGPTWLNLILIIVMAAPVAWRRSRPLTSALAVFGVGALSSLTLGAPEAVTAFVLIIATTFAGAAYSKHWIAVVAGVVVLCSAHAINDPSSEGPQDLFWVFGLAGISLLLGRALYARQHRIGTLENAAVEAAYLHAEQIAAATAAERASIAREIHDLVSHAVAVIVIQAQAGARALPEHTDTAATALRDIEGSARTAMTELRRLLTLLDDGGPAPTSPAVSLALLPGLLDRCRSAGLRLQVTLPEPWPDLPPATEAVAFHVVREAVTNAMRHAAGATVQLEIAVQDGALDIEVTNSGSADGGSDQVGGAGRGLIGIRERVELVDGRLQAGPYGPGFRISAQLPLTVDHDVLATPVR